MKKYLICPFCDYKNSVSEEITNCTCLNCGLAFREGDGKLNSTKTKISKEKFFSDILEALQDVSEEVIGDQAREQIMDVFSKNIMTYYQEIADLYVEAIYEIDCEEQEEKLLKLIS